MGITAIKHITNNSSHTVFIHNHEKPSNSVTIYPNNSATIEIWIPWCTSQGDWQWNHYLSVEQPDTSSTLCWIWQQDNFVRYCTDGQFHDQGAHVPGVAQIDADRLLTINPDNSIIFTPDLILPGDYRAFAGKLLDALMGWYNNTTALWDTTGWWNDANALEAVIDYSLLTQSNAYYSTIANTFEKGSYIDPVNLSLGSWGGFLSDAVDDEGWWTLAWIKAYDLTGIQDYLNTAERIFNDMAGYWSPVLQGGIPWKKSLPNSKGNIQNALFITAAARLYLRTSNAGYLTWAQKGWCWFKGSNLIGTHFDTKNHVVPNLVDDALGSPATYPCTPWPGNVIWTYTQGVLIGGLVDLSQCTPPYPCSGPLAFPETIQPAALLQQAHDIAHAVITSNPIWPLVDANGILWEKGCEGSSAGCGADGPQFKGIFMRNLSYLHQTDPRDEYRAFILRNADSIIFNNRNNANQCGLHWAGPVDSVDASRQSSALDALNAAIPFAWSSAFVSQSVPTSLNAGQATSVTITMKNTGTTTWSAYEVTPPVRLGSQNPQDNTTWGTGREDVTFPVAPGMTIPFTFSFRSPTNDGTYAFQWRMVQETVTWFGDFTPTVMVNVTGTKGKEKEKEKERKEKENLAEKTRDGHLASSQYASVPPPNEEGKASAIGQAFIQPEARPPVGDSVLNESEEKA